MSYINAGTLLHFLTQRPLATCGHHALVKWQMILKTILSILNLNQFRVNLNCHMANCCRIVQGHFESCIFDQGVYILTPGMWARCRHIFLRELNIFSLYHLGSLKTRLQSMNAVLERYNTDERTGEMQLTSWKVCKQFPQTKGWHPWGWRGLGKALVGSVCHRTASAVRW